MVEVSKVTAINSSMITKTFILNMDWLDVFLECVFYIIAKDVNGNFAELKLEQPTLFTIISNYLGHEVTPVLGPSIGGELCGMWYALRDTCVDIATLIHAFTN